MKNAESLTDQLDTYGQAAEVQLSVASPARSPGWTMFAAAFGTVAAGSAAEAAVQYFPLQNVTITRTGASTVTTLLDLDGDAQDDFRIQLDFVNVPVFPAAARLFALPGNALARTSYVAALAYGATISSGAQSMSDGTQMLREYNNGGVPGPGVWVASSTAQFAGLRFQIAGADHFGWMRLHFTVDADGPNVLTAIDWAFDDVADTPITAGAGIPEPSSLALAGLSLLALGYAGLRRRRATRQ